MTLEDLGYNAELEEHRINHNFTDFNVGRVISEHKERYLVRTGSAEFEAEIVGNLRFSASSRVDFPAVGDWVAISEYDNDKAIIHAIFPRKTILERQAIGKVGEKQIIAANVDYGIIVQAADRDFNVNRIERYLTICNASKITPVIILSKVDLIDDSHLNSILETIRQRVETIPLLPVSNQTHKGFTQLNELIESGKTYCFLGSSGVGKSTLINNLAGESLLKTAAISDSTNKGRHTTTSRELVVLPNGGILIDNPGMREIGITDSSEGVEDTFSSIVSLSGNCRFKDCTHIHESGCAVLEGVENGDIDQASYENYLKLEREKEHFESTVFEKRQKDKEFGKMVKRVMDDKKRLNQSPD